MPVDSLESLCTCSLQQNLLRQLCLFFLLNCEMLEDVFAEIFLEQGTLSAAAAFPVIILFWFTCSTYFSQQHFLGSGLKTAFSLLGEMKWDLCLVPAQLLWTAVPGPRLCSASSASPAGALSAAALQTQRMALSEQMLL